jgi:hypothetical protein
VLARIVENWLTSAGELGYQTAFAQLLTTEGYRLLHAPVHHPFEHGKDIVAIASDGEIHAFQLKGGDIGLSELEKIQGQLFALAGTAVTYPGIEPPRAPDRVFLVTNGRLTAPARDRLRAFNDANRQRGLPVIESTECDQLVGRFVAAHGTYLPTELAELNELLHLVLARGNEPFPVRDFARMLRSVIGIPGPNATRLAIRRALTSASILTSYATGPWQHTNNYLGVAQGWLTLAFAALATAELRDLEEEDWLTTFQLARDSARRELAQLVSEASTAGDLVIPDIVDGLVYPARAALVCGYAAAFYLAEREFADGSQIAGDIKVLLLRELDYLQSPGEAGAALLLMIASALEEMEEPVKAAKIVVDWARDLTIANHPESKTAAPDPYHSISEILLHSLGEDSALEEEQFAGEAYTLHVAVEWLARRDYRFAVDKLWPGVTHIHFAEFAPSTASHLLIEDDPEGEHRTWAPATPGSWRQISDAAKVVSEDRIPTRLWQQLYMVPYLPLLFPYRLTSDIAKALDYMVSGKCTVALSEDLASTNSEGVDDS